MRNVYAALCISALALSAGCQNTATKASITPAVPASSGQEQRLGPPDVDFKSEFGLEGQRSNRQVGIMITTYTLKKGLLDKRLTWADKPPGVRSWSEGQNPGLISPEAEMNVKAIKVDREFVVKSLPEYLKKYGAVEYSSSTNLYGLDGTAIPGGFGDSIGYLSQVICKSDDSLSVSPGIVNRMTNYVVTPKIVSDQVIFVSFDLHLTTDATEPSVCNAKHAPSDRVQVRESTSVGFSANLADDEALIISGIKDKNSEKDGEVKIMTIIAQEMGKTENTTDAKKVP